MQQIISKQGKNIKNEKKVLTLLFFDGIVKTEILIIEKTGGDRIGMQY